MTDIPTLLHTIATQLDTAAADVRTAADQWDPDGQITQLETDLAAAQQTITDLETDLDVVTNERDAALTQITQLEAELAACLDSGSGTAPLIASGPTGLTVGVLPRRSADHYQGAPALAGNYIDALGDPFDQNTNATNGTAPLEALDDHTIRAHLAVADKDPVGGATGIAEQHLQLDPVEVATVEISRRFIEPDLGKTGKLGGLVAFDGNWEKWIDGPYNFGFRSCHWWWDRQPGTDRLTTLLALGSTDGSSILQCAGPAGTGATSIPRRHVSRGGAGVTLYLDALGQVPIGQWITVRYVASTVGGIGGNGGWLDCYVAIDDGPFDLAQSLCNIRWADQPRPGGGQQGFNRWFLSMMYGGTAPDYAPDNACQCGDVDIRGLRIWVGEQRP